MKTIKVNSLIEIDKLVAEHIFGWTGFWEGVQGRHYLMGYSPVEQPIQIGYSEREEVWHYSTDIKVAWWIIEQFQGSLHRLSKGYSAFIHIGKDSYFKDANTPELAICLAALKTRDIEVDLNELTL